MIPRRTKLLNEIRKDSRNSLTGLCKDTESPITTVFKDIRNLERNEIVVRHTSMVAFEKFGYPFKVGIFLGSKDRKGLKDFLLKSDNLNTLCCLSNNDYDFYSEFYFSTLSEYQILIDQLEEQNLIKKELTFFMADIKREVFKIPVNE